MSQDNQHRRSRRLSITQHLQRMFHGDRSKENDAAHVSPDNDLADAPSRSSAGNTEHTIRGDDANHRSSHVSPREPNSTSHPSRSKLSVHHNPEDTSRPSSGQSTPQTPRLRLDTPSAAAESPTRPEICVSPTWQKNPVRKSERRATRRLEEERLELEKRLHRLERAEMADGSLNSKREPRRLTKKQPLESSSRTSSVGADESRASRLSSVFSRRSSRSRSRSRSSSVNDEKRHFSKRWSIDRVDLLKQDRTPQPPSSALPVTLPERFGNVISKELTVKPNGLPAQDTRAKVVSGASEGSPERLGVDKFNDFTQLGSTESPSTPSSENMERNTQNADNSKPLKELDRTSFAATLNLDKRTMDAKQKYRTAPHIEPFDSRKTTTEAGPKVVETSWAIPKTPTALQNAHRVSSGSVQSSPAVLPSGAPNTQRAFGPRHQKRFTSSPLASPATFSSDVDTASSDNTQHIQDGTSSDKSLPNQQTSRRLRSHKLPNRSPENKKAASTQSEGHRFYMRPWKHADTKRKPTVGESAPTKPAPPLTRNRDSEQAVQAHFKPPVASPNSVSPALLEQRSKGTHSGKEPSLKELIATMEDSSLDSGDRSRPSETTSGKHPMNHHARGSSKVSLSTKSSRESVDYNTADEAPSGGSHHEHDDVSPSEPTFMTGGLQGPGKPEDHAAARHANGVKLRQPGKDSRQLQQGQVVAKLFVVCCHCSLWHDMPSEVYAKLAFPGGAPSVPTEDDPSAGSSSVRPSYELGDRKRSLAKSPGQREKPDM
ncbi:hypothetical protein ATEIFO6365_0001110500 [Aspergillus terreus]|uniref:Uncharacterized protein n=1 Tax=Aspergillus terreus TaxID=33178 RepID=A0A5M3YPY4_ASPTE|nr:hypothetical protein ATETN484_0001102600 [Aspergillus terreus]GFF12881.1 hypothetical protein ATEIFO6365_0001110500 [Aspergillus terreus]